MSGFPLNFNSPNFNLNVNKADNTRVVNPHIIKELDSNYSFSKDNKLGLNKVEGKSDKNFNFVDNNVDLEQEAEIQKRENIDFSKIDKPFNELFNKLDASSKTKITELLNDKTTFNETSSNHLKALLVKGTLTQKDKNGKTVLDNIHELYKGPVLVGNDKKSYKKDFEIGKEIAKDAVDVMLSSACITQGEHYTCGSASIQNYIRLNKPAELVRMVKELATKGETTLADGKTMNAPIASLNFKAGDKFTKNNSEGIYKDHNTEDRSRFNIIFQSAVMDEIAMIGGDRNPLNPDIKFLDLAEYDLRKDVDGGWKTGDASSYWPAMKNLLTSMVGSDSKIETHSISEVRFIVNGKTEKKSPELAQKLETFFKENPNKQAILMYHKDDKGSQVGAHYVMAKGLVEKEGKTYVEIYNTLANTGKDGYQNPKDATDRKTYSQIIYKSLDDLAENLNSLILFKDK